MLVRKCILLMHDLNPNKICTSHFSKMNKNITSYHLIPWITNNATKNDIHYLKNNFEVAKLTHNQLFRIVIQRYINQRKFAFDTSDHDITSNNKHTNGNNNINNKMSGEIKLEEWKIVADTLPLPLL